jgi:hypothetical protein
MLKVQVEVVALDTPSSEARLEFMHNPLAILAYYFAATIEVKTSDRYSK